jgi:hypothetical protein
MYHPTTTTLVRSRIHYKLFTLIHAVHTKMSPTYISNILHAVAARTTCSGHRSSKRYVTPSLQIKLEERAFSHSGPDAWNSLPDDLRAVT